MKKYLFIAEKPSLMRDIQASYQKHKSDINAKVGDIDFVSLAGHVCRMIEPKEYPEWKHQKWAEMALPLIPKTFKIDKISSASKIISDIKKQIENNNIRCHYRWN